MPRAKNFGGFLHGLLDTWRVEFHSFNVRIRPHAPAPGKCAQMRSPAHDPSYAVTVAHVLLVLPAKFGSIYSYGDVVRHRIWPALTDLHRQVAAWGPRHKCPR